MTPTTPEFGPGRGTGGPDSPEATTGSHPDARGPERPALDVAEGRRLLGEYRAAVEALLDAAEERDRLRAEMHARELHHFETEQENAALTAERDRLRAQVDAIGALVADGGDYHWSVMDGPGGEFAVEGQPCVPVDDILAALFPQQASEHGEERDEQECQ